MALTLAFDRAPPAPAVTVQDVLDHALRHVDPRDFDSLLAAAPMLHALAQDRELVSQRVHAALLAILDGRSTAFYTAQSFVLGSAGNALVRGNLWCATASQQTARTARDALFSYYLAHDHNYNFLTVGYFGPGYWTRIYDVDPASFKGDIGERVQLTLLEDTDLPEHKVMAYRAYRDLHTQRPPETLSVSLNLMVRDGDTSMNEQYTFEIADDDQSATITAYPEASPVNVRVGLVELAGELGGDALVPMLEDVARSSRLAPRVRAMAVQSLGRSRSHDPESLARLAYPLRHRLAGPAQAT